MKEKNSHTHCLLQRVSRCPQTPRILPYSAYKIAVLCVLYIYLDAQLILPGANTGRTVTGNAWLLLHSSACSSKRIAHVYILRRAVRIYN